VCFLGQGDVIPFGIICILSGLTFGAEFLLPALILKKVSGTADNKNNVINRYATLAFLAKIVAIVGCAPLLLYTGLFNLSAAQTQIALLVLYGFVPCLIKTIAAVLLWRWIKTNGENDEKVNTHGDVHAA